MMNKNTATVKLLNNAKEKPTIIDLSASGMGLKVSKDTETEDSEGLAEISLEAYPTFTIQLKLVRQFFTERGDPCIGVQFFNINEDALRSLSKYLIDCHIEQNQSLNLPDNDERIEVTDPTMISRLLKYYCIKQNHPLRVYLDEILQPISLTVENVIKKDGQYTIITKLIAGDDSLLEPSQPQSVEKENSPFEKGGRGDFVSSYDAGGRQNPPNPLLKGEFADPSERTAQARGCEYIFTFPGYNAINYFKSTITQINNESIQVAAPSVIHQTGFRTSIRAKMTEDTPIQASINHPRLANVQLTKQLTDSSAMGFSMPMDADKDILFLGERIGNVVLSLPDGDITLAVIIRSIFRNADHPSWGFEILAFRSAEEKERWKQLAFFSNHLHLALGDVNNIDISWKLLRASGYLDEIDYTLHERLEKSYHSSWKLHSSVSSFSRYIIGSHGKLAVGTMAFSLIYPRTWLVHHFGVDSYKGEISKLQTINISQEMYIGGMYLLNHMTDCDHYVIYSNSQKSWNRITYQRFFNIYNNNSLLDSLHAYKYITTSSRTLNYTCNYSNYNIISPNSELLYILSKNLKEKLHPLLFESFSYRFPNISFSDFEKLCQANNYERKRTVYFAEVNSVPVAALIAETGGEGINVFNLLNSCWIFPLGLKSEIDMNIKQMLLLKAIEFYKKEQKAEFIYWEDESSDCKKELEDMGFRHHTVIFRWIAKRSVLPIYLNYISELYLKTNILEEKSMTS